MNFNKIKELIKGLVHDSTSTEDAEQIGKINQELDNAEKEHNDLITKQEELREKYVKAITNTSFDEKPKESGNWINIGFMVCEPEIFNYMPKEPDIEQFEPSVLKTLSEKKTKDT